MKKFLNVMGCIGAALFSIVLVLTVLVFSLRNAAGSLTKPSTITQVVQNIDINQLIPDAEDVLGALTQNGNGQSGGNGGVSDEEMEEVLAPINALLESKTVEQILDLYVQDVLASVTQNNPEKAFTPEAIKAIVNDNTDELVDIVKPFIPENEVATDEEIEHLINEFVGEFAEQIAEFLPELTQMEDSVTLGELLGGLEGNSSSMNDDLGNVGFVEEQVFGSSRTTTTGDSDNQQQTDAPTDAPAQEPTGTKSWAEMDVLSAALRFLLDPAVTIAFVVAIVLLAGIIYGCRFPRFGGLLWLGVDALVIAGITGALAILLASPLVGELIPEESAAFITPVIGIVSGDLTATALICLAVGVVFIVGVVLLRRFVCNRQPAVVQTAENKSALPETAEE